MWVALVHDRALGDEFKLEICWERDQLFVSPFNEKIEQERASVPPPLSITIVFVVGVG
jgi:hypothetical protein